MSLENAIQELAKSNSALAEAIKADTAARYFVAERMGASGVVAPAPVESQEATQPTPEPIPEQTYKPEGFKAVDPVDSVDEVEPEEAECPEEEQPPMDPRVYMTEVTARAGVLRKATTTEEASSLMKQICSDFGIKQASDATPEMRAKVLERLDAEIEKVRG